MKKDNLEKLNNFLCVKKQENKKYQEKIEREKSEILKYVEFSGCEKKVLKAKDSYIDSIFSFELVSQSIDIEMLKNALVDKYDVILADFYDTYDGIFLEFYQYIILIPKDQDVIPYVIVINTMCEEIDVCNTNKQKASIDKRLKFAIKRYIGMVDISDDVETISQIKKLRENVKYIYKEQVFNDKFIKKYLGEYLSNFEVIVHCDAEEKLVKTSTDKDLDNFNLNVAKSIYNKFCNKREIYYNEVCLTNEGKIVIKCENVLDDISCEVEEIESSKKIGYIPIKEMVTKITITYLSGKVEKDVVFIAHKEIFKQGVLKDFLNN